MPDNLKPQSPVTLTLSLTREEWAKMGVTLNDDDDEAALPPAHPRPWETDDAVKAARKGVLTASVVCPCGHAAIWHSEQEGCTHGDGCECAYTVAEAYDAGCIPESLVDALCVFVAACAHPIPTEEKP